MLPTDRVEEMGSYSLFSFSCLWQYRVPMGTEWASCPPPFSATLHPANRCKMGMLPPTLHAPHSGTGHRTGIRPPALSIPTLEGGHRTAIPTATLARPPLHLASNRDNFCRPFIPACASAVCNLFPLLCTGAKPGALLRSDGQSRGSSSEVRNLCRHHHCGL